MKEKIEHWCEWTCPFCLAGMSDPVKIRETTCSNGHTCFLGKAHETNRGFFRAAYKSKSERSRKEHDGKLLHEHAMMVMSAVFKS